jgi:hypothetical protein
VTLQEAWIKPSASLLLSYDAHKHVLPNMQKEAGAAPESALT